MSRFISGGINKGMDKLSGWKKTKIGLFVKVNRKKEFFLVGKRIFHGNKIVRIERIKEDK